MFRRVLVNERRPGGRERGRRHEPSAVVPEHDVTAMAGQADRRPGLERDGRDARRGRGLRAHLVGKGRDEQPRATIALRGCGALAVDERGDGRVVGAVRRAVGRAVEPLVEHHPMRAREGAGADRRVPGARDGVEVRVDRPGEAGAAVDQAPQAPGPLVPVARDVVATHLVDADDHEQRRRRRRLRDRLRARGGLGPLLGDRGGDGRHDEGGGEHDGAGDKAHGHNSYTSAYRGTLSHRG